MRKKSSPRKGIFRRIFGRFGRKRKPTTWNFDKPNAPSEEEKVDDFAAAVVKIESSQSDDSDRYEIKEIGGITRDRDRSMYSVGNHLISHGPVLCSGTFDFDDKYEHALEDTATKMWQKTYSEVSLIPKRHQEDKIPVNRQDSAFSSKALSSASSDDSDSTYSEDDLYSTRSTRTGLITALFGRRRRSFRSDTISRAGTVISESPSAADISESPTSVKSEETSSTEESKDEIQKETARDSGAKEAQEVPAHQPDTLNAAKTDEIESSSWSMFSCGGFRTCGASPAPQ